MNKLTTVLITGASSGIGYELAKEFASHNCNLVLIARNSKKLDDIKDELIDKYGINVFKITQDLSAEGAANRIFNLVKEKNITVDILINNAGCGKVGFFNEIDSSIDFEMIKTNIIALTELTKVFSKDMVSRRKGKILNVASTGSFSPGPFIAVYYATKAYVLSFSEAIYKELKQYNVSVTTLCPGAVRTNFSRVAGKEDSPFAITPDKVAKAAYKGVIKGKKRVVPGLVNKILIRLPKVFVTELVFRGQRMLSN